MIAVDPWLFLVLVFSATGAYVGGFLYVAHWLMHRRPKSATKLPPPPSRIIRP